MMELPLETTLSGLFGGEGKEGDGKGGKVVRIPEDPRDGRLQYL